MRVTVLSYLEKEDVEQFDVVIEQVVDALRHLGHSVSVLGVHGDLDKLLQGIRKRKPELIFNLMESFGPGHLGAVGVVGMLELLGIPFTGGGAGEFYLQEDKSMTKRLLAFDQIAYPDFAVFMRDAGFETGGNLRMPLFVKPLRMDASIGIDGKSIVHSSREMMERVVMVHTKIRDDALVEEFIDGREFYVGVLGNLSPVAFPPIEIDFSGLPEGLPRILDSKAKWDESSVEFKGTKAVIASLGEDERAKLHKVALGAYRALRVRDYGRIDLRLTEAGEVFVIEVNASCYLEKDSEFARSARAAGLEYPALIERIVAEALQRGARGEEGPRRKHARSKSRLKVKE
jgi:D-alanine-D-alanine ligase